MFREPCRGSERCPACICASASPVRLAECRSEGPQAMMVKASPKRKVRYAGLSGQNYIVAMIYCCIQLRLFHPARHGLHGALQKAFIVASASCSLDREIRTRPRESAVHSECYRSLLRCRREARNKSGECSCRHRECPVCRYLSLRLSPRLWLERDAQVHPKPSTTPSLARSDAQLGLRLQEPVRRRPLPSTWIGL